FDLAVEVPLRARLLRVSGSEHVLVFVVHHIAADGFSMGPFTRDVMVAYEARTRGQEPGWAPLEVQYADYAIWQRAVLGDESDPESVAARQIGYWSSVLAGLPELVELPTDRPRPAVASGRGAVHDFVIDAALHEAAVRVGREHGASLFMVVHAALAVLLARLSSGDDVAVGTP
ncbi:condensation domain-containing protein, partial [Rhodococcus sp. SJ]|uniref:condensation domain-containing protein n=1 Tax=Rhodococcus sp. SJ TaxID=3434112 RepID=UPI003D7A3B78